MENNGTPLIIESLNRLLESRKRWVEETGEALRLIGGLPMELQLIDPTPSADVTNGTLFINYFVDKPGDARPIQEAWAQKGGAVFEKPDFNSYSGDFTSKGETLQDGTRVVIQINKTIPPPNCVVVKKKRWATYFAKVCKDDEVKA